MHNYCFTQVARQEDSLGRSGDAAHVALVHDAHSPYEYSCLHLCCSDRTKSSPVKSTSPVHTVTVGALLFSQVSSWVMEAQDFYS